MYIHVLLCFMNECFGAFSGGAAQLSPQAHLQHNSSLAYTSLILLKETAAETAADAY
jgi:hypothetical protein